MPYITYLGERMDLFYFNLTIISFIFGNFVGLEYSYRYPPYHEKRIDKFALISSILGGFLLLTPLYIIGAFFIGFPLGMRSGYGRIEFLIGLSIFVILYLIRWWYVTG